MVRVVLDTNILVSALIQPQGPPAQIFLMALTGTKVQLCMSAEMYAEYEEVIRRPRLKRSKYEVDGALTAIREKGFWIKPLKTVNACSDPDDNIFLECAEASKADYLVTGNLRHFPSVWAGTRIVSARQFLERFYEFSPEDQL